MEKDKLASATGEGSGHAVRSTAAVHTSGVWRSEAVSDAVRVVVGEGRKKIILARLAPPQLPESETHANGRLMATAPELLEVARIEQELHMGGYTKATAQRLGPDAEYAYRCSGSPGLNDWRRRKREAAIAKAEGATHERTTRPDLAPQPPFNPKEDPK